MKEKKERREGRAQPAAGPCLWCHRMDDRAKCTSRLLAAVFWPKAIEKKEKVSVNGHRGVPHCSEV